jgi:cytoskeletal protein CcmA (bactofilin family)
VGDIRTARIVIEDGAYFKGNVDIVRAEVPKSASATPAAASPRPATTSASPTTASPAMAAGAGEIKR